MAPLWPPLATASGNYNRMTDAEYSGQEIARKLEQIIIMQRFSFSESDSELREVWGKRWVIEDPKV